MAQTRLSRAELAAPMQTLPQVLINVAVADKATVADAPSVRTAVAKAEAELATPAESCCALGTNRWSASWWKPPTRTPREYSATRVAESVSKQR